MKAVDVFLAVLVTMLWGFTFVVIEVGLGSFPPIFFSALRFLCAAFPAVLFLSRDGIHWRWILSIGFTLGVMMFGLLFIRMDNGMPVGLSSLVLQVKVVFTLLLSGLLLGEKPTNWQKIGVVVAFAGIGLLAVKSYVTTSFLGLLLVVSAVLPYPRKNKTCLVIQLTYTMENGLCLSVKRNNVLWSLIFIRSAGIRHSPLSMLISFQIAPRTYPLLSAVRIVNLRARRVVA